ncbi:hypothetical protein EV385_6024 [Krasilnikovia cinnamomea]|uniref:N-acetyltransferase domain-containing protein n=1 Tax=Krasilnikovia cinnamomea TaxID=349313 RepID=A0A4Q7ZU40_9ACTN|nr:hypothetical protein EV385_6024 [Krasilnikovia cinnamomea]
MRPGLEIRIGGKAETESHKGQLLEVYRNAYADKLDNPFLSEERHWERLQAYASADGYALAEGWMDDCMVGCALGYRLPANSRWWQGLLADIEPELIAEDGTRTFALTYMMVRTEFRRQGIARTIHDALLGDRPEARATLLVQPSNTVARHAYDAWGWYEIGKLKRWIRCPPLREDDQAGGGMRRRTSSTVAGPGCQVLTQAPSEAGVTMPSSRNA